MDYDKIVKDRVYWILSSFREPWMSDDDFSEIVEDSINDVGGWELITFMFKRVIESGNDIDQMTLFIKSYFDEVVSDKSKQ